MKKALFVVLEGIDGVGKDTQADRLVERARARGFKAAKLKYPVYESVTGRDVVAYQRGDFGELGAVSPHLACYLYAVNHLEARPALRAALASNDLVVAARYVPSNIAFMSARVPPAQRSAFRMRLEQLNYTILGNDSPPDHVVVLDLPAAQAANLMAARRQPRRDIHDEDQPYQEQVRQEYRALAANRSNWSIIDCASSREIRSVESIANEIAELVFETILPAFDGRQSA